MIAVTVKRAYYDATSFGTDEKGVLRVYRGDEVIAQYEAGADITASQEAALPPYMTLPDGLNIPFGVSVYGS